MIDGKSIINVGPEWRSITGGVSAVESQYSLIYKPWRHVVTAKGAANTLMKYLIFIKAVLTLFFLFLIDRRIRIVHVHGASYSSFARKNIVINLAHFFKKKTVFHCHGAKFKQFTANNRERVLKMLHKVDCVVCLSESWKEWFETECECKNVIIISNIIPEAKLSVGNKSCSELSLLFLGYLGERKGIYDLLDTLAQLKDYNVKLYFGGNGEVEKVTARVYELAIENKAEYLGWISGEAKIDILNRAHVYVLPSYNEGLPISILEAMSYGLPIVTTPVGGIPSVVKDNENGFLVQPGDKEALQQAILKFVKQPALITTMGAKSTEKVKAYLPDAVEEQLKQMYESL